MPQQISNVSLPAGTLIGRYEIREVLGVGGFGITYKAQDTKLKRLVALKEYLPAESAVRVQGSSEVNAYESRADEYQYGLERFLDEAKTLAKFQHPNIIGVLDHLELNNTAYLVMVYEQGQTLSQQLKQQGKIPELELKTLTKAILTGLQHIHEHDYYHRDIKPGNIYLRKQGEPVLIDFGAARQAIGNRSRSLTSIVSAGYAPSEQYGSNQSKQGAWSDIYSVGATLYRCISNQAPVDAPTRQNALFEQDPDPLISATTTGQYRYTDEFLQLIDWMLQPAIKNRPQNVAQVMARLDNTLIIDDAPTTAQTVMADEIRTTAPTRMVSNDTAENPILEKTKTQTLVEKAPVPQLDKPEKKSKIGLIFIGILGLGIGLLVISQTQTLQQWTSDNEESFQIETAQSKAQKITADTHKQETEIQARVEAELKKREQQKEQAEQKRLEALVQQQQKQAVEQAAQEKKQQIAQQQTIQTLLTTAKADIKQLRLSSPKGNNAVEKYQQILQLSPQHKQAEKGLTDITEKYLQFANKSIKNQQFKKARQYLTKATNIQVENLKTRDTEQKLKLVEQDYQQQVRLAEQNKQREAEEARVAEQERQKQAQAQAQAQQARLAAPKVKIGDTGPEGGIVFYVDSSGNHGLEAKRADEGGGRKFKWRAAMTAAMNAASARTYGKGWYLPSKRELNLLYKQKDLVGGFANFFYWSSTEFDYSKAWEQYFDDGEQSNSNKYGNFRVRAVKGF